MKKNKRYIKPKSDKYTIPYYIPEALRWCFKPGVAEFTEESCRIACEGLEAVDFQRSLDRLEKHFENFQPGPEYYQDGESIKFSDKE